MGASHLDLHSEGLSVSGAPRGPALPLLSPLRPGATVESVVSALSLPTPPTPRSAGCFGGQWSPPGSACERARCACALWVCARAAGVTPVCTQAGPLCVWRRSGSLSLWLVFHPATPGPGLLR